MWRLTVFFGMTSPSVRILQRFVAGEEIRYTTSLSTSGLELTRCTGF